MYAEEEHIMRYVDTYSILLKLYGLQWFAEKMSVRDSINIGGGRSHYIRIRTPDPRIPNAEDAYIAVSYFAGIFLPELPVPYFPRY